MIEQFLMGIVWAISYVLLFMGIKIPDWFEGEKELVLAAYLFVIPASILTMIIGIYGVFYEYL